MQRRAFSFYGSSVVLLVALLLGLVWPVTAQATSRAYEVIQFGAHDTIVREISFDTASVTGLEALSLTGLDVEVKDSPFGAYVCSIAGVGDCTGAEPYYWSYYIYDPGTGTWGYSMTGAGSSTVSDGAIEGWAYLSFSFVGDPILPSAERVEAVPPAAGWLQTQQDAVTGGYGSQGGSAEALLAVGSDGYRAAAWMRQDGARSLAGYWMANGAAYANKSGDSAGKLAVGLQSAGGCWVKAAPRPSAFYSATTGMYASGAGPQSWAILGALALGEAVPVQAVDSLKALVQGDGGWEWQAGFGTDTNTTALVIQALLGAGEDPASAAITNALAYLKSAQKADGGIAYNPTTTGSDANSSAYTVMAIQAAGQDPTAAGWTENGETPISYLLSLQLPDGSFEWQAGFGANALATSQSIAALLGNDYVLRGGALSNCPTVFVPWIQK